MKKAIVVGASSGIGRALARELAANGYEVGLASRRLKLLEELQKEISSPTFIKQIDVSKPEVAMVLLQELIKEMGGLDMIVLNSGVGTESPDVDWKREVKIINVNVTGFIAMARVAIKHFSRQGSGHIVGISSIAALRGSASGSAYSASKAFVSNYMEGLRLSFAGSNIYVTDIRPGLVDTDMVRWQSGLLWVQTPEKAARQIYQAVRAKKKIAYVTKRWGVLAQVMRFLPDWVYCLRYKVKK